MKIQAIGSAINTSACQPIKQIEFAKKKSPEAELTAILQEESCDVYTPQDNYTSEQKYNMACRIAAYYKTQYEQLLEQGGCLA